MEQVRAIRHMIEVLSCAKLPISTCVITNTTDLNHLMCHFTLFSTKLRQSLWYPVDV